MMKHRLRPSLAAALLLALLATGCINLGKGTARMTRLYVLTAMASAPDGIAVSGQAPPTIGVGPLTFPDYLDRPQLVTRAGSQTGRACGLNSLMGATSRSLMRPKDRSPDDRAPGNTARGG